MSKKGRGKNKQTGRRDTWRFFPLYGLEVHEDDGLHGPIFGDATILSPDSVIKFIEARGERPHPLMLHAPLTEVLPEDTWSGIAVPREHLLEIPPHAFIAVRRNRSDGTASRRAAAIRSMLSASLFLRALRTTAFAEEPRHISWYAAPSNISAVPGKPLQTQFRVEMNEHVIQRPLRVQKPALRRSWRAGSTIANQDGLNWDINQEHPLLSLLGGRVTGSWRNSLLETAMHLQESCCSTPYRVQLQMAVTAFERLLRTSQFSVLQSRARAFFPADDLLQEVLQARHEITHQGVAPADQEAKKLARHGLMKAWILLDIAVGYLGVFDTGKKYEEFLEAQATSHRLDQAVVQMGGSKGVIAEAFHEGLPAHPCKLTLRADFHNDG